MKGVGAVERGEVNVDASGGGLLLSRSGHGIRVLKDGGADGKKSFANGSAG